MTNRKISGKELELIKKWLDNNQNSQSETIIQDLEKLILEEFNTQKVICTNSAMGALHLALQTIGVGPGDEVIVDPIVVFAGMAVMYQNAVPIFADINIETYNINPESIENRITNKTKAIICTHHFGSICDMQKILEISKKYDIPLIEDCAHALHATQNGKKAGLFGDFSAFSFNHRKQLSTGQGGFLLINSEKFVEKSKDKGFGRVPARLTWNYAMSGIIACIALAQWDYSKEYVKRDHQFGELFNDAVKKCEWLKPQKIPMENWSPYHIWASTFEGEKYGIEYKKFLERLKENGADYFLPSFMPYGAFNLEPSPCYRYPLFSDPKINWIIGEDYKKIYQKEIKYEKGICKNAEYIVPRMLNTVLSPIEDVKIEKYITGLEKTILEFS